MANLVLMECINDGPVKNASGLRGRDIGWHDLGLRLTIDMGELFNEWAPIAGPEPFGPTWMNSGEQGWVKVTRFRPVAASVPPVTPAPGNVKKFEVTINFDTCDFSVCKIE